MLYAESAKRVLKVDSGLTNLWLREIQRAVFFYFCMQTYIVGIH